VPGVHIDASIQGLLAGTAARSRFYLAALATVATEQLRHLHQSVISQVARDIIIPIIAAAVDPRIPNALLLPSARAVLAPIPDLTTLGKVMPRPGQNQSGTAVRIPPRASQKRRVNHQDGVDFLTDPYDPYVSGLADPTRIPRCPLFPDFVLGRPICQLINSLLSVDLFLVLVHFYLVSGTGRAHVAPFCLTMFRISVYVTLGPVPCG